MATKKKTKHYQPSASNRKAKKSYKADSVPLAELNAGDSISGTFQGRKLVEGVMNPITKTPNDVWFYNFVDLETGDRFAVSGRAMLDQAFEDAATAEGGIERLIGVDMTINRGEDQKTGRNFNLGTYEIVILEDEE